MTLRDQICQATDELDTLRRQYFQQQASYEQVAQAATKLLELRRQAEERFKGKTRIQINAVSIARLIRSSV
jgi:hypothetical protein